eukprot:SAG11_NODE_70_length_18450_cov_14.704975_10_plen_205_part_00
MLFEPANIDATWQTLVAQPEAAGRSRSALGWEYYHRLAELSFLFDSNLHKEQVFSRIIERLRNPSKTFLGGDGQPVTVDDDVVNQDQGIYELGNRRTSLIQLRAKLGTNVPEDQRGLLALFEAEIYGVLGPLPANLDTIFTKCMQDWQKQTKTQIVKSVAQSAAKGRAGGGGKKGGQKPKKEGAERDALAAVKGKPKVSFPDEE